MGFGWFDERNRYKVEFDFISSDGIAVHTDLDGDGEGFDLEDALYVQHQLKQQHRNYNVIVTQIKEIKNNELQRSTGTDI